MVDTAKGCFGVKVIGVRLVADPFFVWVHVFAKLALAMYPMLTRGTLRHIPVCHLAVVPRFVGYHQLMTHHCPRF